ncbi:MAG TPA: c-type cytochrome biogenesis protein CcsB [Frankiaceae bacterium]|nr:c-type cytochrome biogenesis protein CcsB [Frankiaceae bacterium]
MSKLSDHLFLVTILVYAVAMVAFAADLAFRRQVVPIFRSGDVIRRTPQATRVDERELVGAGVSTGPGGRSSSLPVDPPRSSAASAGSSGAGGPGEGDDAGGHFTWLARAAVGLTALGWLIHLATIVTRGIAARRVPWGNMFEFSTVAAFICVTAFLVLLAKQRARWLGTFVLLPVVLYLGLAGTVLYKSAGPLVPALNSYWLKIHVLAAITASGLFFVSGIVALLYLAKSYRPDGPMLSRLPAAEKLDRITYGIVALSFPIWTFAVIAGAIWAEAAWGRYWGWDPKETWSFITWVIYAGYLHARSTAGWRGRRAAWFAVAAFAALIVNYYVVNIWIVGLHSYAGVG